MGSCHQAGLPSQGHEDQVPGGDLSLLAHQESEIINFFLGASIKDKLLKIMLMQEQPYAGQKTQVKAFVTIGDYSKRVGLGAKCSKEVATTVPGAIIMAKLSVDPVW